MKKVTLHFAAAFIAAGTLLGAEGKPVVPVNPSSRAPAARMTTASSVAPNKTANPAAPVRWLALSERPCDSTACRMVRFPWSSVPGS